MDKWLLCITIHDKTGKARLSLCILIISFVQCRNVGLNSILEKSGLYNINYVQTLYTNQIFPIVTIIILFPIVFLLLLCAVIVELFNHLEYWWIINSRNSIVTSDNFRQMKKSFNPRSGWNYQLSDISPCTTQTEWNFALPVHFGIVLLFNDIRINQACKW